MDEQTPQSKDGLILVFPSNELHITSTYLAIGRVRSFQSLSYFRAMLVQQLAASRWLVIHPCLVLSAETYTDLSTKWGRSSRDLLLAHSSQSTYLDPSFRVALKDNLIAKRTKNKASETAIQALHLCRKLLLIMVACKTYLRTYAQLHVGTTMPNRLPYNTTARYFYIHLNLATSSVLEP